MPDENQTAASAKAPAKTQTQADVKEEREVARYDTEQLRAEARARFGVSPHLVFAALSTSSRKTHTVEEAQDLIDKALKSKVETEEVSS